MHCPDLHELPPPPPGKTGWPWTEETPQAPDCMPDGSPWPRVSIVTPSYNQAEFIEETIRSVLLQGYPDLEYIIIDGGSTDGSVDIIRKYEPWLAYWVSEKDEGQSDAINKGFGCAAGSILAWINSDDFFLPSVIEQRALAFHENQDAVLVYGDCLFVDNESNEIGKWCGAPTTSRVLLLEGNSVPQQTAFFLTGAYLEIAGIDNELHYVMDYVLWVKLGLVGRLRYRPGAVAKFRYHLDSKSSSLSLRFHHETLTWFDGWELKAAVLNQDESAKVLRRLHLAYALDYVLLGDHARAAEQLSAAILAADWNRVACRHFAEVLVHGTGISGQTIFLSRQHHETVLWALSETTPASVANEIRREVVSSFEMAWVFRNYQHVNGRAVRRSLLRAITCDPSWLFNRGVISIGIRSFA